MHPTPGPPTGSPINIGNDSSGAVMLSEAKHPPSRNDCAGAVMLSEAKHLMAACEAPDNQMLRFTQHDRSITDPVCPISSMWEYAKVAHMPARRDNSTKRRKLATGYTTPANGHARKKVGC